MLRRDVIDGAVGGSRNFRRQSLRRVTPGRVPQAHRYSRRAHYCGKRYNAGPFSGCDAVSAHRNVDMSTMAMSRGATYRTSPSMTGAMRLRIVPSLVIWLWNMPLGANHPM